MRRLTIALLAACLLGTSPIPAIAQEQSPPPWFGGRVEMPEHGFAVTLPDDWVGFDTSADGGGQVAAVVSRYPDLPPVAVDDLRIGISDTAAQGVLLMSLDASVLEGTAPGCGFGVRHNGAPRLDEATADLYYEAFSAEEGFAGVERPTRIDLPGGSAWVLGMLGLDEYDPDDWDPMVVYLIDADAGSAWMTCTANERPVDDWLSIAETFELLAGEE